VENVTIVDNSARTGIALASLGTTFLRLGLAVVIAAMLALAAPHAGLVAATGIFVIMALDYSDGVLFRRSVLSSSPSWRIRQRLTDSAVDRMVVQIVCLSVLAVNHSFWPLYVCVLVKEVVFWMIGTWVFLRGLVVFPGFWAKIGMVLLGTSVALFSVGLVEAAVIAMGIMAVLAVIALLEYLKSYETFLAGGHDAAVDPQSAHVLKLN